MATAPDKKSSPASPADVAADVPAAGKAGNADAPAPQYEILKPFNLGGYGKLKVGKCPDSAAKAIAAGAEVAAGLVRDGFIADPDAKPEAKSEAKSEAAT
jgi:hypothetical protein